MEPMSPQIDQLAAALAAAQAELEPAKKDSENPAFRSKYASLAACFDACRDVLPKHGLAITQTLIPQPEPSLICVRTILLHTSGQYLSSDCLLNSNGERSRTNPAQAAGSAITYARRYGLSALVGIVADDDDDGNACESRPAQKQRRQQAQPAPAPQQPQRSATWKAFQDFCKAHYKTREAFSQDISGFFGREIASTEALSDDEMADFMAAKMEAKNA